MGDNPVMLENNWFPDLEIKNFVDEEFVEGSFFKTLSQKFLIEITGSEQELRAEYANERTASFLKMKTGAPILHISIKFYTAKPNLNIYSELYCNTEKYPIGNCYHLLKWPVFPACRRGRSRSTKEVINGHLLCVTKWSLIVRHPMTINNYE